MYMYMYAHDYIIWGCSYEKLSYAKFRTRSMVCFLHYAGTCKKNLGTKEATMYMHMYITNLPVLSWRVLVRSLEGL